MHGATSTVMSDPDEADDLSIVAALNEAEWHARIAHDCAYQARLLHNSGTAIGQSMAPLAVDGYLRNSVLAAAYLAAAGFGDDYQLHLHLHLDWLGREP